MHHCPREHHFMGRGIWVIPSMLSSSVAGFQWWDRDGGEIQRWEAKIWSWSQRTSNTHTIHTQNSWCFEECSAPVAAFFGHKFNKHTRGTHIFQLANVDPGQIVKVKGKEHLLMASSNSADLSTEQLLWCPKIGPPWVDGFTDKPLLVVYLSCCTLTTQRIVSLFLRALEHWNKVQVQGLWLLECLYLGRWSCAAGDLGYGKVTWDEFWLTVLRWQLNIMKTCGAIVSIFSGQYIHVYIYIIFHDLLLLLHHWLHFWQLAAPGFTLSQFSSYKQLSIWVCLKMGYMPPQKMANLYSGAMGV